jgi:hypothetical protein
LEKINEIIDEIFKQLDDVKRGEIYIEIHDFFKRVALHHNIKCFFECGFPSLLQSDVVANRYFVISRNYLFDEEQCVYLVRSFYKRNEISKMNDSRKMKVSMIYDALDYFTDMKTCMMKRDD